MWSVRQLGESLKCPTSRNSSLKAQGGQPFRNYKQRCLYERRVGVENVKATLATPLSDQLGTDIWKLNERESSTVFINPLKAKDIGGRQE
jgi:hypothetical protein